MELLNTIVNAVNEVLWSYVLIVVLVGCGLYFTLSTRFVQIRMLPEMLHLLTEGIGKKGSDQAITSILRRLCRYLDCLLCHSIHRAAYRPV